MVTFSCIPLGPFSDIWHSSLLCGSLPKASYISLPGADHLRPGFLSRLIPGAGNVWELPLKITVMRSSKPSFPGRDDSGWLMCSCSQQDWHRPFSLPLLAPQDSSGYTWTSMPSARFFTKEKIFFKSLVISCHQSFLWITLLMSNVRTYHLSLGFLFHSSFIGKNFIFMFMIHVDWIHVLGMRCG